MGYADYNDYIRLYSDELTGEEFARLAFLAHRRIDNMTTGVDGFHKLAEAFPTDEYAAEAVKRCECALVNALFDIETAAKEAKSARGFNVRADGSYVGKQVTSITAGAESITYSSGGNNAATVTEAEAAARDPVYRERMLNEFVQNYLGSLSDANGVNLLYMGVYPRNVR